MGTYYLRRLVCRLLAALWLQEAEPDALGGEQSALEVSHLNFQNIGDKEGRPPVQRWRSSRGTQKIPLFARFDAALVAPGPSA